MSESWVGARFLERSNRFRVRVALRGRTVDAFLPNPGRLRELLVRGSPLRLVPRPAPNRATDYDVLAVRAGNEWVCLDTRLANDAVATSLSEGHLAGFAGFRRVIREARWRDSRFDFLLEGRGRLWLEVKSVSLVSDGRALFPDAPTTRGARHLRHLAELRTAGDRAAVLFVVLRPARRLAINEVADPEFLRASRAAYHAGVLLLARQAELSGTRLALGARIPIDL